MIPVQDFKVGEVPSAAEGIRRQILTHGTYAGLTYEQVLANDVDHCEWHLDNLREDDEAGLAFADWLRKGDRVARKRKQVDDDDDREPVEAKRARVMDFGKFRDRDLTYGDVFDSNPAYCLTLLEKQDHKPVGKTVRRFLTFIKQTGVDLNARVKELREQRRAEREAAANNALADDAA
eukprot:jgi/Tetstr1/463996/TSEL_008801.t1